MKVTIVDRSEKAALKKTRQILCKYLDRVSHETYLGNISQQGLINLRNELLSSRAITRQASISAYLHRNGRTPEILWTLGSKDRVSEDGIFAYKAKRIKRKPREMASPLLAFMAVAVRLAGLFHDLGKGTVGFNEKLRKAVAGLLGFGEGQDPVRHELISALLIDVEDPMAFMKKLAAQSSIKPAFVKRRQWLASEQTHQAIEEGMDRSLALANKVGEVTDMDLHYFFEKLSINNPQKWAEHPFWMTVLWLVFTHHKLPSGHWNERQGSFTCLTWQHIALRHDGEGMTLHNRESLGQFLSMPEQDQPWCHRDWTRSVSRCIRSYFELREQYPEFEKTMFDNTRMRERHFGEATPWLSTMARIGRLSLVIGDYEASCDHSKQVCKISPQGKLFANTKQEAGTTHLADFLHVHLEKVGDIAPKVLHQLFINQDREFFNPVRMDEFEIPQALAVPVLVPDTPYAWQGYTQKQMVNYRHTDKGFFCVVAAGTGRGKTRACAAMMCNSRKNPRFSVLLNMRSLTFQTASAYLGSTVGFRPDQVAMLVGDDVLKRRFREQKRAASERMAQQLRHIGTDNVLNNPEEEQYSVLFSGPSQATLNLHSLKEDHFLMRLLSAPVSVMTVDHIIRLIDLAQSSDIVQMLHLMSTDLVFDEIDDYKGDDLVCIGRLIELAGQFGRRVIIASATLPKTVVEGFREAYLNGYAVYQQIYRVEDADSLVVTHMDPYVSRHEAGNFGTFYEDVMATFTAAEAQAAEQNPRRRVMNLGELKAFTEIKAASQVKSKPQRQEAMQRYFKGLVTGAVIAHNQNALTDEASGLSYSAGFIRLNTVASAQKFVNWLATSGELEKVEQSRIMLRVVCYHAQNLGLMRVIQERFLERHLNRTCMNQGQPDPLLESEDVQLALGEAKACDLKKVIFLVVTSSIMETGRDFDFDWCVLEPCSTTSVVQGGGRVRRHRLEETTNPNIFLMPVSLNGMLDSGKAWRDMRATEYAPRVSAIQRHQTAMTYLGVTPGELKQEPDHAGSAFSDALLKGRPLHAGHCLKIPASYAEAPLTVMERIKQLGSIRKDFARQEQGVSMKQLTLEYANRHADALLCNTFYEHTLFRGRQRGFRIEYLREFQGWFRFNHRDEVVSVNDCLSERYSQQGCKLSMFLIQSLNLASIDELLALSGAVAQELGYRRHDLSLGESALLSTQRNSDFTRLLFNPQVGFYESGFELLHTRHGCEE